MPTKSDEFRSSLTKYLPEFDLSLTDVQIDLCLRHYELMLKWNRSINLSRITEPDEAARFHYCESMFADRFLPSETGIADLGSGAGFPGIPLSILRPERTIKLVDSNSKKAIFLKEAVRALNLTNAKVFSDRFQKLDLTNLIWVTRASEELGKNIAELFKSPDPVGLVIFLSDVILKKVFAFEEFGWKLTSTQVPLSKGRFVVSAQRS
ncbi:MAG TPA: 16S rRNA (guanine(527)-N(7))-methyltransferase RsmG [Blastocatellia bacterium]|nr:16S rRNA (guanine(527)-N(7))-methyltransferase RsmG [Blastocatellia bacterium]